MTFLGLRTRTAPYRFPRACANDCCGYFPPLLPSGCARKRLLPAAFLELPARTTALSSGFPWARAKNAATSHGSDCFPRAAREKLLTIPGARFPRAAREKLLLPGAHCPRAMRKKLLTIPGARFPRAARTFLGLREKIATSWSPLSSGCARKMANSRRPLVFPSNPSSGCRHMRSDY